MAFNVCSNRYANWHMNETSGTNVPDSSGFSRNGTTVNTPTWVAAKLGNGLQFVGGLSQYVDCGAIASFERTQSCSYEFWINSSSASMDVLNKYDGTAFRGTCITQNGTVVYFLLATDGTHYLFVQGSVTIANSNWHHVIITYNGTSTAGGVLIYEDGTVDPAPTILSNNLNGTIITANNFGIARSRNAGYFTGKLDEVVVYDRVLTATEVAGRWNAGKGTQSCRLPSANALLGHDF